MHAWYFMPASSCGVHPRLQGQRTGHSYVEMLISDYPQQYCI